MNILIHMGDAYPVEEPDAIRMRTFYDAFKSKGHEVTVMAPCYGDKIPEVQDVCYCKTPPLKNKSSLNRFLNQIGFGFASFFKSFRIGKIDLVITSSPPALISPFGWLIAKFKRAKLVYDVRDIWPDVAWEMGSFDSHSIYSHIFEAVRNFMLKHSDLVTAVTKGKTEKLKKYAPEADVIEIANGLDEQFLNNRERPELIGKYNLDRKFTCVYFGNIGLAQGLMQLMHVAQKAKDNEYDVQFLIFGSGVDEQYLKAYAKENKLENVAFEGRIPHSDLFTILKHAGMSFIPLVNDRLKDSVPTKLFEALGVGCPVLLAAAGDAEEILNECKLGIAVKPNDESALWDAFDTMYHSLSKFLNQSENAQKVILEKYSRQKAALQMVQEVVARFD